MQLGAGPLGYKDWQRLANYDGPLLVSESLTNTKQTGTPIEEYVDVSRYASVHIRFKDTTQSQVHLEWFDAKKGILLDTQVIWTSPSIGGPLTVTLPNRGPWLLATWAVAASPVTHTVELRVHGSNRLPIPPGVPEEATVIFPKTVKLASLASTLVYPEYYYGGPVQILLTNGEAKGLFLLEVLTPAAKWHIVAAFEMDAVHQREITTMLVPNGAWRLNVFNFGAAEQAMEIAGLASPTGAS